MAYNKNQKIQLTDTPMDAIVKISEGNPGAATVCMKLMESGDKIDPDGFMGGFGTILGLDTRAIYGCRVWMLYKDVCGEHLGKMSALLRAVQLGFFSDTDLDAWIDGHYRGEKTLDGLIGEVQERLPSFNLEAEGS